MKMSTGDVRALADKIRRVLHTDLEGRSGIGNELEGCDREVREEIDKTHTDLISKEIEAYFT